jgi:hypothetical protein
LGALAPQHRGQVDDLRARIRVLREQLAKHEQAATAAAAKAQAARERLAKLTAAEERRTKPSDWR